MSVEYNGIVKMNDPSSIKYASMRTQENIKFKKISVSIALLYPGNVRCLQ